MSSKKQKHMADAVKAVAPADFEFVRGKGIHPFYLNMTLDEVIAGFRQTQKTIS